MEKEKRTLVRTSEKAGVRAEKTKQRNMQRGCKESGRRENLSSQCPQD